MLWAVFLGASLWSVVRPEARAVTLGKSVYEVAEQGLGWVGDSTWFMGKGIEFIGKVKEAWIPS